MPATPASPKATLRAGLRQRRREHVARLRDEGRLIEATGALARRVIDRFGTAATIAAYLSDGDEPDPLPILAAAAARGLRTALPSVTRRGEPMRFHLWSPGDALVCGPFGLSQPPADTPEATPDLILAPLVGFDRAMTRLGQGGGFYDRMFAACPDARRVGLAWSAQLCEALPVDPWDMPLHGVATELEWIERNPAP